MGTQIGIRANLSKSLRQHYLDQVRSTRLPGIISAHLGHPMLDKDINYGLNKEVNQ